MTMNESIDVLVVGGANTDYLVRGTALPRPGETVAGERFLEAAGGKGANQAVAAARLGARVAFVARVGADDRGRALVEALRAEGVDTSHVVFDDDAETGVAVIMVDARGEKQIMTAPGANSRLSPEDVHAAAGTIANAKVVLVQLEVPLPAVDVAVRLGRAAGAKVVLDPAPPQLLAEELLVDIHVIRPNALEAETLTGVEVECRQSACAAARNLMRRGVGAVIVGAPGGDLVVAGDEEVWLPHRSVDVVDTTGAGDAFAAAIASCLALGQDLFVAARFANAAAAIATTRMGARDGLPSRTHVLELLTSTSSPKAS
jgi:ribokinase